jgi:hypothetical protein
VKETPEWKGMRLIEMLKRGMMFGVMDCDCGATVIRIIMHWGAKGRAATSSCGCGSLEVGSTALGVCHIPGRSNKQFELEGR